MSSTHCITATPTIATHYTHFIFLDGVSSTTSNYDAVNAFVKQYDGKSLVGVKVFEVWLNRMFGRGKWAFTKNSILTVHVTEL